ncbi:Polymyxin resistance protein ArnT, undecaprenyl phosphate-alpha-L-Ara4N transferase; Melittin resistance protein PqaB [hydrothermal vent metagenome]|uniref:Polymyxin resistance protein ArnT, undecaprenyl phosphate-alpha-L-Ara4N transferase Melittin resistance protein PqaB n=1 Tax=hydrothermal vent metagenome TaxID=652676 RepID=A0A3B0REJ4_9ZZZZ
MSITDDFDRNSRYLILALFVILILRVIVLSAYPLMDTTEARYAEIAREMVATNNWITPQLDPGKPFWAKPPLSIWATALSFKLFGISEFTARFPSLLFAIGNMFLVFILARHISGVIFALRSCVILATTGLFYFMAGGVMTDPSLSFTVTLSMVSFLMALSDGPGRSKPLWGYLFFVGLGLSLLAKGPVGIVLTLFPVFLWIAYKKKWKDVVRSFPIAKGALLTTAIALPWHIIAELKTPGFLKYYLIGEHFKRFVVSGWKGDLYGNAHTQPKGMIWLFLIPTTLPWLILFFANIQSVIRKKRYSEFFSDNGWVSYLVCWFLTPMIFFTFAGNILMSYILPGLPAFALLTAHLIRLNQNTEDPSHRRWYAGSRTFIIFTLFIPLFFTAASFTVLPQAGLKKSNKAISQYYLSKRSKDSRLIYTRKMPYSADFYSNGRAFQIKAEFDKDELLQYMNDGILDFYVVKDNSDLDRFYSDFNSRVTRLKTFDRYVIFSDKK